MKRKMIGFKFVDAIPEKIDDGTLYVAMEFATAVHKCCCGCGEEVVTPLSPTDWKMTYDGESVSLSPSVGNWSFKCRSHYWIVGNEVRWSADWSPEEIAAGRARDRQVKGTYYGGTTGPARGTPAPARDGFWVRLRRWLFGS